MPLRLRSDAGGILRTRDGGQRFSGSAHLGGCVGCDKSPRIRLSGPATLQPQPTCTQGTSDDAQAATRSNAILLAAGNAAVPVFDASSSADPSGRAAWADVRWALGYSAAMWPAAGRAALQAAVDRANALPTPADRLQLALTAAETEALPEYGGYELRLSVTTWLGLQGESSASFRRAGSDGFVVRVEGAREQAFSLSGELRATARLGATSSTCQQASGSSRLQWLWTAPSGWVGLPNSGYAGPRLVLPAPVPALPGQVIFLRVTATDPQTGASAFEDIAVTAQPSPPIAQLAGPTGAVAPSALLVFNASTSRDPDAQALAAAAGAASSLGFSFTCQREDLAPCFSGTPQGILSEGGRVWSLPAGLLKAGVWHTISVNITKQVQAVGSIDDSALHAVAKLSVRVSGGAAEPRLQLSRLCATSTCGQPHSSGEDLRVRLALDPQLRGFEVRWSSEEVPSLASLPPMGDASSGFLMLAVPASALPPSLPSISVTASVYQGGQPLGAARGTWPLRASPSCGLDASAAACFRVSLSPDTFPTAVVEARALGWVGSSSLVYEFGIRRRDADEPQQLGASPTTLLVGLSPGNTTVYCCAVDQWGARNCATANVLVRESAVGFGKAEAEAALAQVGSSAAALQRGGDLQEVAQAALQASLMLPLVASSNASADATTAVPANASSAARDAALALIRAVAATLPRSNASAAADPQAVQVALSAITALVGGAGRALGQSSDIEEVLALAVDLAEQLRRSSAVSVSSASQLSQIIATLSASTIASEAANASSIARAGLMGQLSVASSLVGGLSRLAMPEAQQVEAGSWSGSGMWIAAGAAAPADDFPGSASTSLRPALGARRLLKTGDSQRLRGVSTVSHRKLLAAPPPVAPTLAGVSVSVTAGAAAAVANASAASSTAMAGRSLVLGLTHLPASEAGLAAALGTALPSNLVLRSGLVMVQAQWAPSGTAGVDSSGASLEPVPATFDCCSGSNGATEAGQLLVHVPLTAYDASAPAACLSYDATSGSVTGDTLTSAPGTQQASASYVAYNAATGRLTCRVAGSGAVVVAQARVAAVDTAATDQTPRDVPTDAATAPTNDSNSTAQAAGVSNAASVEGSSGGGSSLSNGAIVAISVAVGGALILLVAVVGVVAYRRRRRASRGDETSTAGSGASRSGQQVFWWQVLLDAPARRANSSFTHLGSEMALEDRRAAAGAANSAFGSSGHVSFLVVRESGTVESRRVAAPPPPNARSLRRLAVAASAAAATGLPQRVASPTARGMRASRDFFALPNMLWMGGSGTGTPRRNSQTAQLGGRAEEAPDSPPAAGGRSSGTFRTASRLLARMMASHASATSAGADGSPRAPAADGSRTLMPAPSFQSSVEGPAPPAAASLQPPPLPPRPPLPRLPPLPPYAPLAAQGVAADVVSTPPVDAPSAAHAGMADAVAAPVQDAPPA
ncbi:hypothetical protein HXX76_002673 [Chlamydomonas incerta]|uniref:PKD/REJ-like domain-containing protein n=1 Tax=Chlamydomonas incerta TaxID=51695 RepID=A0A835W952_CHLIN|nr:hypothetical protein HXX76_002673 [Chlamydomonas incerta]|eukprot:KAG2442588.1 hypothetical protein HXX76_002673 [Chlamydomonas incerta]